MPYRNLKCPATTDAERAASPKVLGQGSHEDRVWITLEAAAHKVAIEEAILYYTMNPKPFDTTRGHREEWFPAPATISKGRVEASMPPGATHAAFCLRDANGFLISSEALPSFDKVPHTTGGSEFLEKGYAYKPGLFALIKLGKQAQAASVKAGLDSSALKAALATAQVQFDAEAIVEKSMCDAIRALRAAIRRQKGIPQADHPQLNRFPTEPLF